MGWVFANGTQQSFTTFPNAYLKALQGKLQLRMERVVKQAVEDMRRFTETRPSAKSGRAGRVDTGEMLESIAGRTFNDGVDKIVGEFGFLSRKDLYFMLQTSTGFRHYISSEFIEPTFAMRDAAVIAIQNLLAGLKEDAR